MQEISPQEESRQNRRSSIRVGIVTTAHPWSDPRIFLKQARSLAAAGYDVTLLAPKAPADVRDDVKLWSLPAFSRRLHRMLITPWIAFGRSLRFAVIHFHDPEFIPVAVLLKLLGKIVIYDVHEDLPRQIEIKHWIPPSLRKPLAAIVEGLEVAATALFDRIVAATPTIANRFREDKTVLVMNFPIVDDEDRLEMPYHQRPTDFVYAGVISEARGASIMTEAFSRLSESESRLHLAGTIVPAELEQELRSKSGIVVHGMLDKHELVTLYRNCRVGLVVLQPSQNYIDSLPTKMFEYMLAGLAVVASDFSIWRDILEDARAGSLVDPTNPDEVRKAMRWLLDHPEQAAEMGRLGRAAVLEKYQWATEARKLVDMYDHL